MGEEDIELFLFIDCMIVYTQKKRELAIKIKLISNDSKSEGFKINHKYVAFLYIKNKEVECEIEKKLSTLTPSTMKYLSVHVKFI